MHRSDAFSVALNTVNVGKFNLCTASIGMCEHAFYEAINHANNRILYGNPVTDFPHVRASFVEAYVRLAAMKLFSDRAIDYFRSASLDDRRYLLFNPVTKSKVTSEGRRSSSCCGMCWPPRAFERNTYFAEVARLIGALPRLEGTVHVNVAQILKFMPNHLFSPAEYPRSVPATMRPTTSSSGRRPGAGSLEGAVRRLDRALREVRPHSQRRTLLRAGRALRELLVTAAPDAEQQKDLDFMLVVGHLFTLVVYGQLILSRPSYSAWPTTSSTRSSMCRSATSPGTRSPCMASRVRPQRNRNGRWLRCASRSPTPSASIGWQQVRAFDGAYQMRP